MLGSAFRKTLVLAAISAAALAALRAAPKAPLRLPLKAEVLTAPQGTAFPSYDTLELSPLGAGRYDAKLSPGEDAPRIAGIDLTLLVPRVPRLSRGSESLTRLALIQREFNRNEIHNVLADGTDFSIANNCLERGLWEVKLAKTDAGRTTTSFHAWFTFPKEEYAGLFARANGGLEEEKFDGLFAKYPGVGGFALPLDDLRSVKSTRVLSPVESHAGDALDALTEQKGKTKLIRTKNLATYADVVRPASQPIALAKFTVPGLYDPNESMTFDLSWLGKAPKVTWRQVASPRASGAFPELELSFANGLRVLAADARLANLPARRETPAVETDVLKFVCGIGTPIIHAKAEERAAEMSEDRPRYLLILDAKGNHVDTHLMGVDGLYAWREAGEPGKLHVWLVSYERIALIAHFSVPWPAAS
jgi:hypothetical protein